MTLGASNDKLTNTGIDQNTQQLGGQSSGQVLIPLLQTNYSEKAKRFPSTSIQSKVFIKPQEMD